MQLSEIGLINPTGYFVQDLWTGQKLGLMKPSDRYLASIPATGVSMIKATLAQQTEEFLFEDLNSL